MLDQAESKDFPIHQKAKSIHSNMPGEFNTRSVLTIFGATSAAFVTLGFLNAFGIFLEWYQQHQLKAYSTFDITWIGSFCSFMFFVSAVPAGLLTDRNGPTILMITGGLLTLFSVFMISLCTEYYQFFLAQGTLLGVGSAFLACPAITMISKHFDKHRGLATGFTIAGSSLGGIIWPIMIDQLLNKDGVSFAWTIRSAAFFMLPLVILSCVTVRVPSTDKMSDCEKDPTVVDRFQQSAHSEPKKFDVSIVKNPVFLTFTAGLGIYYFGMWSPLFFITSYAVDAVGTPTDFAFYLVSTINAASLIGRILGGWLADRYGCFNVCFVTAISSAATAFCWTAVQNEAGLVIWCLAVGFTSGCIVNFQAQCAAKLSTPDTYGTAIGLTLGIVSVTGLFGSPIAGELLKSGYFALSMYAGATLVAGGILIGWARSQLSRSVWKVV